MIYCILIILMQSVPLQPISNSRSNLVGVWQANSSGMAAGWGDAYRFFKDGSFRYHPAQAEESFDRIVSINGNYILRGDSLVLEVRSSTELTGGTFERDFREDAGLWLLKNTTVKIIPQEKASRFILIIGSCSTENDHKCLTIDGVPYYKMRNDPEDYN